MKNKKIIIISVSVIATLLIFIVLVFNKSADVNKEDIKDENSININYNTENKVIEFLSVIAGVRANNIEIINNPVGFKGQLFAPRESILNGIEYFLKNTENDKMNDLKVDIGEGFISIYVNYKVNNFIKTPIEVKINPTLNDERDLVVYIEEVKFLDLKIANWIVDLALNSFVKDWFPSEGEFKIEFNKGNVVILKENLKGINLQKITLEEDGLSIDAIIDLKSIVYK